jgi:diguanylate cyclase (GGDEF)-like protein
MSKFWFGIMAHNNDKKWTDENSVIKDSVFNRAVTGVRQTQHSLPAMQAPNLPSAQAMSSSQAMRSPNATQSRMQAMSASQAMRHVNSTQTRMQAFADPNQQYEAEQRAAQQYAQPAYAQHPYVAPPTPQPATASEQPLFQPTPKPAPGPMPLTQEQIEQRAFYDSITNTHNFSFLVRTLDREMRRAQHFGRPLSVLVVALPSLKLVKAQYGLLPFSMALTGASQVLLRSCGPIDMVGKYGDERFLYLCPEKSVEEALQFAEGVRAAFETLVIPCQYPIKLSPSIGVATYSSEFSELESLIALADLGADLVIQQGGNGHCYAPHEIA